MIRISLHAIQLVPIAAAKQRYSITSDKCWITFSYVITHPYLPGAPEEPPWEFALSRESLLFCMAAMPAVTYSAVVIVIVAELHTHFSWYSVRNAICILDNGIISPLAFWGSTGVVSLVALTGVVERISEVPFQRSHELSCERAADDSLSAL